MPEYIVPIVSRKLESLWYEHWCGENPTKKAIAANQEGALGQSVNIKAKNRHEAKSIAEAQNPDNVAIFESISRLG